MVTGSRSVFARATGLLRAPLLTIEIPKGESDVCLCKAECDALVFQLLGKLFQILRGQVLLEGKIGCIDVFVNKLGADQCFVWILKI